MNRGVHRLQSTGNHQTDATAGLVGVANETNVNLNGLTVRALIESPLSARHFMNNI